MREPIARPSGPSVALKAGLIASLITVAVVVVAALIGTTGYLQETAGAEGAAWSGEVLQMVRGILWRVVGAAVGAGAVVVIVLWWLMDDVVGGRVRSLTREVERTARGEAPRRVTEGSRDELGVLVASFNRLMRQVDRRQRETRQQQRATEDALEQKRNELKRVNQELSRTWQDRVQHEKLVSLGRMAAGVAHEVRNPLNAISLTVAYLQEEFVPADEERRVKFSGLMTNIQGETRRLEGLVRRFLDFSRPARPRLRYDDILKVVKDVVALVQEEASGDGIGITTEFDSEALSTMIDSERMREAFWNVIINAIQAMPGGGELCISSRVGPLREGVELSFADSGPGILESDMEKVFDPYYTTKDKGVGLGLAIVQRIMEDHRGKVTIGSSEGAGATVNLWLPIRGELTGAR